MELRTLGSGVPWGRPSLYMGLLIHSYMQNQHLERHLPSKGNTFPTNKIDALPSLCSRHSHVSYLAPGLFPFLLTPIFFWKTTLPHWGVAMLTRWGIQLSFRGGLCGINSAAQSQALTQWLCCDGQDTEAYSLPGHSEQTAGPSFNAVGSLFTKQGSPEPR